MSQAQTQTTLRDYHDPAEFTTEKFAKTIVLRLQDPTKRKRQRLDNAIDIATKVTQIAAERMPGVPKERWGTARPAKSTWYNWAKSIDADLSNKTVHENIQRVREAFRSWQSKGYDGERPTFKNDNRCTFYYEQPKYSRRDGNYYLSLPLASGQGEREHLPLRSGNYAREYLDGIIDDELSKGRGELLVDGDGYRFHQVIRDKIDVLETPEIYVGVDIGLTNLAVAGAVNDNEKDGAEIWSGTEAAEMRTRFAERKRQAQQDAEYDRINDEEQRYIEHKCHRISREVVEWAIEYQYPAIVLEDLTDIRDTFLRREREHTADERRALHSWPFRKLQDMIEYKAVESGIPVEYIQPEHTSQECNKCGHTAEINRESVYFECVECGYQVNADVNAAFNIANSV